MHCARQWKGGASTEEMSTAWAGHFMLPLGLFKSAPLANISVLTLETIERTTDDGGASLAEGWPRLAALGAWVRQGGLCRYGRVG